MTPPRARRYSLSHVLAMDDVALREVLPAADPEALGAAATALHRDAAERLGSCLGATERGLYRRALATGGADTAVADAERQVVASLFWPLLYWHDAPLYDELVAGERLHPAILGVIGIAGHRLCDIGAGSGRFTRLAAPHATEVVAVDLMPSLLDLLRARLEEDETHNVDIRRGGFTALPLNNTEVDIAVSCSAVTWRRGLGGEAALRELERVTRPDGRIVIIWPDHPDWFRGRGFELHDFAGNLTHGFRDVRSAVRLCREFYGDDAAEWVRRNATAEVPYEVLGIEPPNTVCIRDLGAA